MIHKKGEGIHEGFVFCFYSSGLSNDQLFYVAALDRLVSISSSFLASDMVHCFFYCDLHIFSCVSGQLHFIS